MRTGGLFQFMRFVCNLPRTMRFFDFGRNYAKNYASIIRQGLIIIHVHFSKPGTFTSSSIKLKKVNRKRVQVDVKKVQVEIVYIQ